MAKHQIPLQLFLLTHDLFPIISFQALGETNTDNFLPGIEMGCFSRSRSPKPKTSPPTSPPPQYQTQNPTQQYQQPKNLQQQVLFRIPGCKVHLMDEGETLELANGDFVLENILENNVSLATIIKVGEEIQWPLTNDEPVVKLDALHYLFSLPMKDGDPLSYGVTFPDQYESNLGFLDSYLKEHSCFSTTSTKNNNNKGVDWKEYAPRIEDYNNVLAKAIAEGTGQIVRGIFTCSNAYTNQVQKGGETTLARPVEGKSYVKEQGSNRSESSAATKKSGINENLKRVKNLSKMTSELSKSMLDGVGIVTGSVMGPVVNSQAGKAFFAMVPGQVLLASLDGINKILEAAEVAEKQALSATSGAATRMVSNRFGESAGETTEDVFATTGHIANTAWNIFKIRKAINPASSVKTGVLKNAAKSRNQYS